MILSEYSDTGLKYFLNHEYFFPFAFRRILKKVTMDPSERLANLQALWDSQTVAELGPCGENEFECSNRKSLE